MPTITLHTGTVTDYGTTFGTGGGLTGSGALWDDASDSTYLESKAASGPVASISVAQGSAPLEPLVLPSGATVTGVTFNSRVQQTSGAYQTHIGIVVEPDTHLSPQYGPTDPPGDVQGIEIPSSGSILDLATVATDFAFFDVGDLDGLVSLLEAGNTVISARVVPDISGSTVLPSQLRVYELSVDVTYDAPVDTPCDTWVDLDLSTATFANPSGDQFGQYVDGVITGLDGNYPQFWFDFLLEDPKRDRVEVTFDPGSAWDGDGNPLTSDRFVTLRDASPGFEDTDSPAQIGDGASNTDDVCTLTIGPGIGNWDDPDFGVAQGYTRLLFQTSGSGAVSAIRFRKICTTAIPPLRLTNRRDQFSSAPSLVNSGDSRQGGNHLTGYL